ncbi:MULTISPECIES: efflux RND transporter periplasmic adaptor subunit [unclassified Minwuia]|jgi:membrane fusion protein, multidrug efflux system|uniref:efflux RND transporter periplasmic adaptor subunit n=1 Tax=unclassified Minwuia TaxID=2618799 RepID=UPI0024791482|nr:MULTISPECIES: efflux RND transporter periplasmic adaptor subunit [unclassified Minwuia]
MASIKIRRPRGQFAVNLAGFGALLVVAVLIAVLLVATRTRLEPTEPVERVWNVETLIVARHDHQPHMKVFGELAAGRSSEMRALVQGEIAAVGDYFRNGAAVAKGDLLIEIDRFEYEAAIAELKATISETRARIAEAEANRDSETISLSQDKEMLVLLQRDLDRTTELHGRGNISDKSLDQAKIELTRQRQTVARREAAVKSNDARVVQQRAALQRLGIELERAERDLERTRLVAPFDGFLSEVNAQLGQRVSVNDRIARLVGAAQLEARGHLSDAQYGRLLADGGLDGRLAKVVWTVGERKLAYDAVIARITAEIRPETGGVTFYALLAADGLDLPIRPGAFVSIELPDRRFPDSIRIPSVALHDENHVFVVGPDDRLERRAVTPLARADNDVIVTGELNDGDTIVLTRFNEIGPGVLVRSADMESDKADPVPTKVSSR